MVFIGLSMICNGLVAFSMILQWFWCFFIGFAMFPFPFRRFSMLLQWFSLLFQAFANHCATIRKSMKSNFSMGGVHPPGVYPPHRKVTFHRFPIGCAMVSIVLSVVCYGFVAFSMVFAMVFIHPFMFAMVSLLFHWFCNAFTPLAMVCNGFHCFQ